MISDGQYHYYWGWMNETKKIRGSDTVNFKHKYITNPSITMGDTIVNAAQQFTSALSGSIPPPLVKSGIDHLIALSDILNATKEVSDDREDTKSAKTIAHSLKVPIGSTPPRVDKDKNIPDLVPTNTSGDNNKRDTQDEDISTPARKTCSQSTSLIIMDKVVLSC